MVVYQIGSYSDRQILRQKNCIIIGISTMQDQNYEVDSETITNQLHIVQTEMKKLKQMIKIRKKETARKSFHC